MSHGPAAEKCKKVGKRKCQSNRGLTWVRLVVFNNAFHLAEIEIASGHEAVGWLGVG